MNFLSTIRLSRPRFWIYEFGTFLVGIFSAVYGSVNELLWLPIFIFGFYFLIPSNILIYGINDMFDYETDKLNPKKVEYEDLLLPSKHKFVWTIVALTTLPFLFFIPASTHTIVSFLAFIFFASFYSALPIRAKAIPFADSFFSASHYVVTAVFGFYLAGGTDVNWLFVIAGVLWAMAMHAYSAVPDIQADTDAHLSTVATFLGHKKTIIFCTALYFLAGVLGYAHLGILSAIFFIPYGLLMLASYDASSDRLFRLYTYFPYVNFVVGMGLFFSVLLSKL